jgi:hypothetical protein
MHSKDSDETSGATADASDAVIAVLSARLDALLASWELAMRAKPAARVGASAVPREPAAVLADLERELAELERKVAERRRAADLATKEAGEWERRAMSAIAEGRDDSAKEALSRTGEHMAAAETQRDSAADLEPVLDSYRNAVAAVRATIQR